MRGLRILAGLNVPADQSRSLRRLAHSDNGESAKRACFFLLISRSAAAATRDDSFSGGLTTMNLSCYRNLPRSRTLARMQSDDLEAFPMHARG